MIKASGRIWGGKLTLEAMDLKIPANLFTVSNLPSTSLKYSEQPSNFFENDSGNSALVILKAFPGNCGSFWYNSSVIKGIIGCKSLIPFSRHMNNVRAVCSLSSAVPLMNKGLVA